MEARRREAVEKVQGLLRAYPERIEPLRALGLCIDVLGANALLCDAARFMAIHARAQGYDLPAYDLACCGEIREFLADAGVRNVPQWYALIGVDENVYRRLHEYQLLVLMNGSYQRQAIPIHALWWDRVRQGRIPSSQAFDLALYCLDFALDERVDEHATLF